MNITKVVSRNFKGVDGTTELGQHTLIIGRNGTGKTGRLLSISYALTGKVPGVGNRPSDVASVASGLHGCSTHVFFDTGPLPDIQRVYRIGPQGASTRVNFAGGNRSPSVREANAEIAKNVADFAPMFDIRELLDLSAEKRRAFVIPLCSEAAGETGLIADLRNAVSDWLTAHPDIAESVERSLVLRIVSDIEPQNKCDIDRLSSIIEATKRVQVTHTGTRNATTGRLRELSDEKGRLLAENKLGLALAELKERVAACAKTREDIKRELGHIEGQAASRAAALRSIQEVQAPLADIARDLESRTQGREHEFQQKRIDEMASLKSQLDAIDLSEPKAIGKELTTAYNNAEVTLTEARAREADAKAARVGNVAQIASTEDGIEVRKRQPIAQIDELIGTCVVEGLRATLPTEPLRDAWDELVQFVAEAKAELGIEPLERRLAELKAAATKIEAECSETEHAVLVATEAYEKTQEALRDAEGARAHAQDECTRRYDRANVTRGKLNDVTRAHDEHIGDTKRLIDRQGGLETLKVASEQTLAALDEGVSANADDLQKQYAGAEGMHREAAQELERSMRVAVIEDEYSNEAARASVSAKAEEACKVLLKALRSVRDDRLVALLKPVTEKITTFLRRAGWGDGEAYINLINPRGTAIFDIGWRYNSHGDVSLDALSAGESLVFCAALIVALVQIADPPLKLLLLDCGEVDAGNLAKLLDTITTAAPQFQAVVAAHVHPSMMPDNWTVLDLDELVGRDAPTVPGDTVAP